MNKIKGYYIHFEGRQSIGVSKKIDMQIEEFNKWFDMQEIEIKAVPRNLLKRIIGLFPTMSIAREYEKALQQEDTSITDDAMVLEKVTGRKVRLIEGSYRNIKITTPEDLLIAECYLEHPEEEK